MTANVELLSWARAWGAGVVPFGETTWMDTPSRVDLRRKLEQAASFAHLLVVSGPVGVGKSQNLGRWLWALDERLFAPVALTQASLSGCGLLSALVQRLGREPSFRREGNLERLSSALAQLERRRLVVVLDDAQLYSYGALEELRLLLGLNLPTEPTFALILVGDDHLLDSLRLRHHRALFSRVAGHVRLEPWSLVEAQSYLDACWKASGMRPQALVPAAAELLVKASGGVPRSLQLLARAAWLEAAQAGKTVLSPEDVERALAQVPYLPGRERSPGNGTVEGGSLS